MSHFTHILARELDYILDRSASVWECLRGARIFVTGGTGYYGTWLLESLAWAELRFALNIEVVVLSRNPNQFLAANPFLRTQAFLSFSEGDIRTFHFPDGSFSHLIHAATEASEELNNKNPLLMIDTIVGGTRRALEFAAHAGVKYFLHTSSGAVYGDLPTTHEPVPEDHLWGPDISRPKWAYGEGKRIAELLCCIYGQRHGINCTNARCFATIGPRLPLNTHFAVGNFIADALGERDLTIKGDGTPIRSYIDVADVMVWLLHILVHGRAGSAYNVGSERGYSIAEIANKVRDVLNPKLGITLLGHTIHHQLATVYVPSTFKARSELGLKADIPLKTSIQRTADWEYALKANRT